MSILDNTARNTDNGYTGHNYGSSQRRQGRTEDRPQAQVWLNFGYTVAGAGVEGEDVFVALPVGIALDTMQPADERVNSADFAARRQASNALLLRLQEAAKKLEPGEARIIAADDNSGLSVELRRVADKAVADPSKNALIKDIDLF